MKMFWLQIKSIYLPPAVIYTHTHTHTQLLYTPLCAFYYRLLHVYPQFFQNRFTIEKTRNLKKKQYMRGGQYG